LQTECRETAIFRFSSFLLKAFVKRVNLRIAILMVRFWRSTGAVFYQHLCFPYEFIGFNNGSLNALSSLYGEKIFRIVWK